LVRTGTIDEKTGQSINPQYYLFSDSEILSSFEIITQNTGNLSIINKGRQWFNPIES